MRLGKYQASDDSNTVGTAVTFLLVGMGAGALLALLFAPKTGKQMRKDVRRTYEDARSAVGDFAEQAQNRAEDIMDRSAEWMEEVSETARKKVAPLGRALRRD